MTSLADTANLRNTNKELEGKRFPFTTLRHDHLFITMQYYANAFIAINLCTYDINDRGTGLTTVWFQGLGIFFCILIYFDVKKKIFLSRINVKIAISNHPDLSLLP